MTPKRVAPRSLGMVVVVSLLLLWLQVYTVWQETTPMISLETAVNETADELRQTYQGVTEHDVQLRNATSQRNDQGTKRNVLTASWTRLVNMTAENNKVQGAERPDGVPDVDVYLPHLRDRHDGNLKPKLHWTQGRNRVTLVIGIPTVMREKASYLEETLHSVISKLTLSHAQQCLIIVFVAEPWNLTFVNQTATYMKKRFSTEMSSGLLEVMSPPAEFYPNLDKVKVTLNDSKERMKWRTKQSLDYAYLMLQAYKRGSFYLQLEDDVIAKDDFYPFIMRHAYARKNWSVLKFSTLGFIGDLFHSSDLPLIAEFFLMFYNSKPVDWLLDNIMTTKYCRDDKKREECYKILRTVYQLVKPSQFQHIGYHSSLKGKVQKLKDKTFGKELRKKGLFMSDVSGFGTTIRSWKEYTLQRFLQGKDFFWGISPRAGGILDICFNSSLTIHNFTVTSKVMGHPRDMFSPNTTVEVLPEKPILNNSMESRKVAKSPASVCGTGTFYFLSHFSNGEARLNDIPSQLQRIRAFRIHVRANMTHWAILQNIVFNQ